ncbi:HD-GYP domain-containing protein [Fuchsiella alkaliacetigena]|uniref:HD-GYP domain-containing protein n=1 Tax=Fuchsiella alkaliacetigena TaxID=957042 RepID=UPI00200A9772|nr:HD-GYP domain-containing protein [Fuchsiella alkaliacetigena]MCK8823454.1 HD-GYP domain-containing protein [Fuchsiella alkaliacetigena]
MERLVKSDLMEQITRSKTITLIIVFLLGAILASIFSTIQRLTVGSELLWRDYIFSILMGGIPVTLIAYLSMTVYELESEKREELEESYEQLETYNEMFITLNEDLENSYREMNKLAADLESIIGLVSELSQSSQERSEEEFLAKLLHTAKEIITEADYGSAFMYVNDQIEIIEAIGHDISILKELEIHIDSLKVSIEDSIGVNLVDDVISILSRGMSTQSAKKLSQAAKAVKKSLIVNLEVEGEVVAGITLEIAKDSTKQFDKSSLRTMRAFESLASAFFTIKRYSRLQEEFQKEIIISITKILELHDKYTKGHSQNVANLSEQIARAMELDEELVNKAYWAGLVHDIGKILIPKGTLNKPGALTAEEYDMIQKHSYWGYKTLYNSQKLQDVAEYVLYHHEHWKGDGYPEALKEDEIPLVSQIITVADAWDAMRTDRPYRDKLPKEVAIKELKEHRAKQFSPRVVDVFLDMLEKNKSYKTMEVKND